MGLVGNLEVAGEIAKIGLVERSQRVEGSVVLLV